MAMWKSLCGHYALGRIDDTPWEESVMEDYVALQRAVDAVRTAAPHQFHEIAYEQLLQDPLATMQSLYATLQLGEFDVTRPALLRHLIAIKATSPAAV